MKGIANQSALVCCQIRRIDLNLFDYDWAWIDTYDLHVEVWGNARMLGR